MQLKGRHALLAAIVVCGLLASPAGAVTHELRHNSVEEVALEGEPGVTMTGKATFSTFLGSYSCTATAAAKLGNEAASVTGFEVSAESCEGTGALESCNLKSHAAKAEGEALSAENPWTADIREDTALGITGVEVEYQFTLVEEECEVGKLTATFEELVATPDDPEKIAAVTLAGEGVADILGAEFEMEASGALDVAPAEEYAISSGHEFVQRVVTAKALEGEPEAGFTGAVSLESFLGTYSCAADATLKLAKGDARVIGFELTKAGCEGSGELAECELKSATPTKGGKALSGSNAWTATIKGDTSLEISGVELEMRFEYEEEVCEVPKSLFTFAKLAVAVDDTEEIEAIAFAGEGTIHILGLELEADIEAALEAEAAGTYAVGEGEKEPPPPVEGTHYFTDNTEAISPGGVESGLSGALGFENLFGGYECVVALDLTVYTTDASITSFDIDTEECLGSGFYEGCELTDDLATVDSEPISAENPATVTITEETDLTIDGPITVHEEYEGCEIEALTKTFDSLFAESELEGGYLNAIYVDPESSENVGIADLGVFELETLTGGTLEVAEGDEETISIIERD